MALNTINLPFSPAQEDANNVKFRTSVLPEVFPAGDCRMKDGAILTIHNNGSVSFLASLRTTVSGPGQDVWHQRFEVCDAQGQLLFRLPPHLTPLGHQPSWWDQDVGHWVEEGVFPFKMIVSFDSQFDVALWDRISFVTWFGDC